MRNLLQIIKEELSPEEWNSAVKMARSQHVFASGAELNFHVLDPKSQIAAKVSLWPQDEDWHCEQCLGACCPHVAAAAIAQMQNFVQKTSENQASKIPFLQYEFRILRTAEQRTFLHLYRYYLNSQNETQNIGRSLVGLQGKLLYDQYDLDIDQFFLKHEDSRFDRGFWIRIWPLIKGRTISFAGREATLADGRRGFALSSERRGGVLRLSLLAEDSDEHFDNGLVRKGQEFFIASRLSDDPWGHELFQSGRMIGLDELDRLRAEHLPRLQAVFSLGNLDVEAATERLLPQLQIDAKLQGEGLIVQGLIVYGSPAEAVFDGRHYRQVGTVLPRRRIDLESSLSKELEKKYGLPLGEARFWTFAEVQARAVDNSLSHFKDLKVFDRFQDLGTMQLSSFWDEESRETMLDMRLGERMQRLPLSAFHNLLQTSREANGRRLIDWLGQGLGKLPATWTQDSDRFLASLLKHKDKGESQLFNYWALQAFSAQPINIDKVVDPKLVEAARSRIPQEFWQKLRPYQQVGADFLLRMQCLGAGALLADEMGLGKTLQAMAAMEKGCLLVCPASLIFNWQAELKRFRPELSINLYHGSTRNLESGADVLLTSYGVVRQDIELLKNRNWQQIIIDEAQTIKNPASDISVKIKQLPSKWRLALSGTPLENDLRDLSSLMGFLNPEYEGGLENTPAALSDPINHLRNWLRPFYLRRRKTDVLKDLPERSDIILRLEQNEVEKKFYKAELEKVYALWQAHRMQGMNFTEILALLTRLRRAACDYRVALDLETSEALPTKVSYLLENIPNLINDGHAVVIVSQWTTMLDKLRSDLELQGLGSLQLDGRTRDRGDIIQRFSKGESSILLLSLKAGGVGLNLTMADHIFLLDPWWNVAAEEQAFARIHRIGQERPVFMHRLLALGTIEEHVYDLQSRKQELFNQIFDEDIVFDKKHVTSQSTQDLSDILQFAFQGN